MIESFSKGFLDRSGVLLLGENIEGLSDAMYKQYQSFLTPEELKQSQRFRFEADQRRHCIGLAMKRFAFSHFLDQQPEALIFVIEEHGKPSIDRSQHPDCHIHFNISHGGSWVVAVFARVLIGVDIEGTQRDNDVLAIAKHYFFDRELAELTSDADKSRDRFFDLWTLKEAYMKARGEGISLGLDRFGFLRNAEGGYSLFCHPELQDDNDHWRFLCATPVPDHRLSIAIKTCANEGSFTQSGEELSLRSYRMTGKDSLMPLTEFSDLRFASSE